MVGGMYTERGGVLCIQVQHAKDKHQALVLSCESRFYSDFFCVIFRLNKGNEWSKCTSMQNVKLISQN